MANAETTKIRKTIVCRDKQIENLKKFICFPWENFPNFLLLGGHADTGKTSTVEEVFSGFKWEYRVARIDCTSFITTQLLLTSTLDQLVRHKLSAKNGYKSFCRVKNTYEFVVELKKAAHNRATKTFRKKKIFVILKHSEKLVNLDPKLPNFFMRLGELTNLRITVLMLTSKLSWIGLLDSKPITIHFPQYTKEELVMVLCSERPGQYDDVSEAYENYVKMTVDIVFRDCRQLGVIRRQVAAHVGTVMTGDLNVGSMWARLRLAAPSLLNITPSVPLPQGAQPRKMGQALPDLLAETAITLNLELPFCAKFLLIAALLAAHIPPSADAKLFVIGRPDGDKSKKRKRKIVPVPNNPRTLLSPRTFPMDRLYAIFYAIIGEPFPLTVQLQMQVSTLVKLELLRDVSADVLTERKLAFTASIEMITSLARTVDFNLEKYLGLVA